MYLWALLYIWGFIISLESSYTGIQTLIKVLYTQYQAIYPFVVFNKLSVIAISHVLKVTNAIDYHLPTNKIWWYKLEPLASFI